MTISAMQRLLYLSIQIVFLHTPQPPLTHCHHLLQRHPNRATTPLSDFTLCHHHSYQNKLKEIMILRTPQTWKAKSWLGILSWEGKKIVHWTRCVRMQLGKILRFCRQKSHCWRGISWLKIRIQHPICSKVWFLGGKKRGWINGRTETWWGAFSKGGTKLCATAITYLHFLNPLIQSLAYRAPQYSTPRWVTVA